MEDKALYPAGTVIRLLKRIDDPYSPKPAGARMRVSFTDDAGQLHGRWLAPEGGSLAVIVGVDEFIVEKEAVT